MRHLLRLTRCSRSVVKVLLEDFPVLPLSVAPDPTGQHHHPSFSPYLHVLQEEEGAAEVLQAKTRAKTQGFTLLTMSAPPHAWFRVRCLYL